MSHASVAELALTNTLSQAQFNFQKGYGLIFCFELEMYLFNEDGFPVI